MFDPFSAEFDPNEALHSISSSSFCGIEPAESFDEFERELLDTEFELCKSIVVLDEIEKNKRTEMSRRISSKHRLENLQAICIDGKSPLTSKKVAENRDSVQWRSGMIDNERVSVDSCLQKWLDSRSRVFVKLRGQSSYPVQEPNRLMQGVIIAYDKHMNLILRDVDEIYMPSKRLKKVQSYRGAMPQSIVYCQEKCDQLVMHRHLKCSLITGSSIVCIYKQKQTC